MFYVWGFEDSLKVPLGLWTISSQIINEIWIFIELSLVIEKASTSCGCAFSELRQEKQSAAMTTRNRPYIQWHVLLLCRMKGHSGVRRSSPTMTLERSSFHFCAVSTTTCGSEIWLHVIYVHFIFSTRDSGVFSKTLFFSAWTEHHVKVIVYPSPSIFKYFLCVFFLWIFLHKKIIERFNIPLFFHPQKEHSASIYKGAVQCTNIYIYGSYRM